MELKGGRVLSHPRWSDPAWVRPPRRGRGSWIRSKSREGGEENQPDQPGSCDQLLTLTCGGGSVKLKWLYSSLYPSLDAVGSFDYNRTSSGWSSPKPPDEISSARTPKHPPNCWLIPVSRRSSKLLLHPPPLLSWKPMVVSAHRGAPAVIISRPCRVDLADSSNLIEPARS